MATSTTSGWRSSLAGRWPGSEAGGRLRSFWRGRSTAAPVGDEPDGTEEQVPGTPVLSVVVPVHNDQDRLEACLDSLLAQSLAEIEVILVDDGSTDHSPSILAQYAERDPRVKVITQHSSGGGRARNAGVAAASAPYLTFVDSDDTIPPAAYAHMVATLQRSGSDFAVGAVRSVKGGKSSRPSWVKDVHRVERLGITIEDFPDAMHDVIACNRVFRRDFFDAEVGPFPLGMDFEDHAPMVAAYVRARSFDLLSATTSNVRIREDPATLWQQKHEIHNLLGRLAAKELAWEIVSAEASPPVAAAWLGRVLDFDLSLFVEFAVRADDRYRQAVRAAVRRFLDRADAATWRHVRVDRKIRLALAAEGDWAAIDRVLEHFRQAGGTPATRVSGGEVLADLPDSVGLELPPAMLELSREQTSLTACLSRVFWSEGRLEVEGWAYIKAVDLTDVTPAIAASLVDRASGRRVALEVQPFSEAAITRWSKHLYQTYDSSGFRLSIPVAELTAADVRAAGRDGGGASAEPVGSGAALLSQTPRRWQLVVSVAARSVRRQGPVQHVLRSGVAMRMRAGRLIPGSTPHRVVPIMDDALGFVLEVRPEQLRAIALRAVGARQLDGSFRADTPMSAAPSRVLARQDGRTVVRSSLVEHPDGSFGFSLTLPTRSRPEHWDVRVQDLSGGLHRMAWPDEREHGQEVGRWGDGTARWRRSPRGFVQASSRPVLLQAHRVQVDTQQIVVDVGLAGADRQLLERAVLRSPLLSVPVAGTELRSGGRVRLTFPATAALWGSPTARPLPTGTYTLVLPIGAGKPLSCSVGVELLETMPFERLTTTHGVTVARRPGSDKLTIELRAPLTDEERGPGAQRRLAQWFGRQDFTPQEQVFFQCYRGEFSTDSQRAIHQELVRRDTPLDLVWGVHDHSVGLPDGARPVLMGSRAWYEAIGRSRYLCNNNDFDRFFRRRDFQRFLQTFHGYPFKSMGVSFWRARDVSPEVIHYECTRRTDAWTSIVLPASFCEEIYRQEYLYEGEVLITGYPRNDVLVDPDPHVRERVLSALGVSPDKTVVLYAPTWRDTIATGDWSAKFFDALELDTLADALGEDHVILLRGHNFNMREGLTPAAHAQVVDVTRYPEITDLILAADVAILDYSSLRFDWVLTGKPVLFFVPDLADYLSARTALFEYGPTAPGPLLATTAEVIDAVLDLASVSRDYAQARIDFNLRFNGLHDGHATERVVDHFFGRVGAASRVATHR